jgi:hypothetical protein
MKSRYLDRPRAAKLGRETLEIIQAGRYAGVDLHDSIRRAVEGTVSHPPDEDLLDESEDRHFIGPFERAFSHQNR